MKGTLNGREQMEKVMQMQSLEGNGNPAFSETAIYARVYFPRSIIFCATCRRSSMVL